MILFEYVLRFWAVFFYVCYVLVLHFLEEKCPSYQKHGRAFDRFRKCNFRSRTPQYHCFYQTLSSTWSYFRYVGLRVPVLVFHSEWSFAVYLYFFYLYFMFILFRIGLVATVWCLVRWLYSIWIIFRHYLIPDSR